MDKEQAKFYIQSKIDDLTKKRIIVFPKFVKDYNKKHFIIHSIISIVVGVSVPYFLIDFGTKVYHKFTSAPDLEAKIMESQKIANSNNEVPLGSDEVIDIEEVPEGEGMLVNPELKGQYYFLGPNYKIPTTSGLAYVVADVDTGEVIIEKNSSMIMPIASISKLVTSVVAKESMDMHSFLTVTKSSIATYGSSGGLRAGEKILAAELLYPLLMESSNDAAEVFAENYGKEEFVELMNKKVKELGMNDTSFAEPSGLSEKNVSSTRDLQILIQYITKKYPELWDISRVRQYSILKHTWGNASSISRKASFIGGKNGFTYEAFSTTASLFILDIEGGSRRIAITLLKSNNRENDVDVLLRFVTKWVGYLPEGEEL